MIKMKKRKEEFEIKDEVTGKKRLNPLNKEKLTPAEMDYLFLEENEGDEDE